LGTPGRDFYRLDKETVDMTRGSKEAQAARIKALPQNIIIDLKRTALIVIDMQNEFCSPDGWLAAMGADVSGAKAPVGPINSMTAALRTRGVPIIWVNWGLRQDRMNLSPGTQHTFNPTGCGAGLCDPTKRPSDPSGGEYRVLQKDSWGAAITDGMDVAQSDIFVDKHRLSGFWDTPLDSILRNLAIRTVLISGINADQCVYSTLVDANFHGYDTVMVEDAVATTSPSFCLEATLYNVRFCMGFTVKSQDLIASLPPK
jgi:nicotinamidase-related amidase